MDHIKQMMADLAAYSAIHCSAYLMATGRIDNIIIRVQRTPPAGIQERLDKWREDYTLTHKKQRWIAVIGMASGFVVSILSDGRHSRKLWSAGALCCTARFLWTELLMEPDSQQLMANDVLKSKGAVRNCTLSGKDWVKETLDQWYIHDIVKITTSCLAFNFMLAALWKFKPSSDDGFSFFALWDRTMRSVEAITPYLTTT
ncbi:uncharacterized protein LOC111109573 [Crassostrea virginica]|uniref:Uncharacterized protein LOC111109785 n=1 Tax=Crassostrea virginica TaxID=6565 RepID=A0A8B8BEC1_CRAVI|nr:uncharacterized protein LOC111109785 [Crassostrea virginica]